MKTCLLGSGLRRWHCGGDKGRDSREVRLARIGDDDGTVGTAQARLKDDTGAVIAVRNGLVGSQQMES